MLVFIRYLFVISAGLITFFILRLFKISCNSAIQNIVIKKAAKSDVTTPKIPFLKGISSTNFSLAASIENSGKNNVKPHIRIKTEIINQINFRVSIMVN